MCAIPRNAAAVVAAISVDFPQNRPLQRALPCPALRTARGRCTPWTSGTSKPWRWPVWYPAWTSGAWCTWWTSRAWAADASRDQVRVGPCAQTNQHDQENDGQPARQLRPQPCSQQADQPESRKVEPDDMDVAAGSRTHPCRPVVGGVQTPDSDPAGGQNNPDSRVAPITRPTLRHNPPSSRGHHPHRQPPQCS